MHQVRVKGRELQAIVDWAIEGGFTVMVRGCRVVFHHPAMPPDRSIISHAGDKRKFFNEGHLKRKLAAWVEEKPPTEGDNHAAANRH